VPRGFRVRKWLLEDKARLFILLGPLVFLILLLVFLLSPRGSWVENYVNFFPAVSFMSHICSRRIFIEVPESLLGIWLMTAILTLTALAIVGLGVLWTAS